MMERIKMNNRDVLDYCKEMLQTDSSLKHIQNRNIVSRAYYFTYYQCIDHVEKRLGWGETSSKGGIHARTISRLLNQTCNNPSQIEQAALLYTSINNLKKLRTRADYKIEINIDKATANYCVMEAERIGIDLENL